MHRKPVRILVLALVALLVVTAAGCGKKKASSTTTAAATTTAASTTAATTTASASATTTSSTPSVSGLGALAGSCSQLSTLGESFASAISGSGGDTEKTAALLKEFADKTPAAIRPAFETLAAAFQKIADAMKGVSLKPGQVPDAAALAKLSSLSSSINTAALTKAETQIAAWAASNCHA
jgi:hypothetical protein